MYASKRRQRNFKRIREPVKPSTSTNPSKRHRERLNGELETVAQLLPYDPTTLSRLDKLSVLRLAVSFLQAKSHFSACLHSDAFLTPLPLAFTHNYPFRPTRMPYPGIPSLSDPRSGHPLVDAKDADFTTLALKALGGFIIILNDNGEIYYASENVEQFLGFHQSDILHQPLYDLIHSEDREDIRQQLDPNLGGSFDSYNSVSSFSAESLERNVNARFRCLLDNTCGFLRMDVRGKLISLYGLPSSYVTERGGPTNSSGQGALLGLLAVCTPFVPPSSADSPVEELILKTKHQLDATLISMDDRMFSILELDESDLPVSFYSVVHPEDASSLTEAHKEVLKSGSSGLLIYRLLSRHSGREYFVQSSARMFYKNGKMDSIGLTHRVLNEVEGTMLLEKRSSLKAKLLSFDDSLLQSPRTLQSTAALPVPATSGVSMPVDIIGSHPHPIQYLAGPSSIKSDDMVENVTPPPRTCTRAKRQSPADVLPPPPISLPTFIQPHDCGNPDLQQLQQLQHHPVHLPATALTTANMHWPTSMSSLFISPYTTASTVDTLQPWMMPGGIVEWPQNSLQSSTAAAATVALGTESDSYALMPSIHFGATAVVDPSTHFPLQPHPPINHLWHTGVPANDLLVDGEQLEYLHKPQQLLPPAEFIQSTKNPLDFISEATNALLGQ